MEFESWRSYWDFENRARNSYRYIHDEKTIKFFEDVLHTSNSRIIEMPENYQLWRAQRGFSSKTVEQNGIHVYDEELPYPPDRMKPFYGQASDGRANPKGIPILYLATDRKTALSEIRPWVGTKCSVGRFSTVKPLKIIDFSKEETKYPIYLEEPLPEKKESAVWGHINNAFSRPVTNSELHSDYVPTQILTELFKKNGFDGIAYKSNLGPGHNIAIFNIGNAELNSCHLYEIKSVEISEDEITNPYYINRKA